jgi:hypothetical protein
MRRPPSAIVAFDAGSSISRLNASDALNATLWGREAEKGASEGVSGPQEGRCGGGGRRGLAFGCAPGGPRRTHLLPSSASSSVIAAVSVSMYTLSCWRGRGPG